MIAISKAADLIELIQGGQLYWAFPFSKGSLPKPFQQFSCNWDALILT